MEERKDGGFVLPNDMIVLASVVVKFVLTLLLLLNILVSLIHTCSILIKDLVVNTLKI